MDFNLFGRASNTSAHFGMDLFDLDLIGTPRERSVMAIRANIVLDAGAKTFATGLLLELIAALRRLRQGDLMAVIGSDQTIGTELQAWCRFTRNSLVDVALEAGHYRWVIRCGEAPAEA